jgi:hypothetical protein
MQPDLYYKSPGGTQKVRMALYSHFFISIESEAVLKGYCKEIFSPQIFFVVLADPHKKIWLVEKPYPLVFQCIYAPRVGPPHQGLGTLTKELASRFFSWSAMEYIYLPRRIRPNMKSTIAESLPKL